VLSTYTDLNWEWLRDRAKWNNAQNRLGYLVHLAEQTARACRESRRGRLDLAAGLAGVKGQ
jgi:hypothetical protein